MPTGAVGLSLRNTTAFVRRRPEPGCRHISEEADGGRRHCFGRGCGACVVLIATYNPTKDEVAEFSASSCLTLLYNINLCSDITTEGLGNTQDGFHSIQKRMVGFHASQCGFCTPGMCMSIFTSLANADKSKRPEPRKGFSKLTVSEAERAFSGNMCRCTEYRPIVDSCKKNSSDVDLEDLDANVGKLPAYTPGGGVCTFPDFLKSEIKSLILHLADVLMSRIKQYYDLLNSSLFSVYAVKVVVWNTSAGVKLYKDQDLCNKYIDIGGILNFQLFGRKILILEQEARSTSCANESVVFRKLAEHMSKVATSFVRNTASLGGNIVLAQKYPFPSDIATVLLGAASTIRLQVYSETLEVTFEDIFIPNWASDSQKESNVIFETYRAAPRPLGNVVSYINTDMLGHVSLNESSGDLVLSNLHMAFGAYGTEHAIRPTKVEQHLTGKVLTPSVVLEAVQLLRETIVPMEGTSHPEYRVSVAVGFLFSYLSPFAKGIKGPGKTLNISSAGSLDTDDICNLPLSSRRETVSSDEYKPVGEPIKKYAVELQASGEAVYVDDILAPKNCLYGEFIYSTRPLAYVENIKFKPSLVKDIPGGGQNIGSSFMFGDEPLFGAPVAEYVGQALGVVIAETQRYANLAGKQEVVEYDTKDLKPPILTVEQTVQHSSYFEVPPEKYPKQVGEFFKGMAKVKLASQYHFYMETQTALAIPDEDNNMVVYSSTQYPEAVQSVIARCLDVPFSNVCVITRRVGGGFGGKSFRSHTVATAAALCAFKLRRLVWMYLNRSTDMIMIGGRHPIKAYYSVGFKSDGRIAPGHIDQRWDFSRHELPNARGALSFDIKVCKTNTTSKSAMRAPGDTQGSCVAEAIIEHVATNFQTYDSLVLFYPESAGEASTYTLHSIFDMLLMTSSYLHRAESSKQFNNCNKWRKRGISCAPGRVYVLNGGSVLVEVGGVEIGQGLWTKEQQMAVFSLGQLWPDGCEFLLDRLTADTPNLIQDGLTAGRTSSESSCNMLVDKLKPVMEKLKQQWGGAVSWDVLISQAVQDNVNLSSGAYWVPSQESNAYLNYGAGRSEVEIDLLTGAITLLRSGLVYDYGMSLNPAIEGSFIQGIGFFTKEEHETNTDGMVMSDSTWVYKILSVDTVPKQFNAEVLNTGYHKNRVLSSKASGEPVLVLAASVHCAVREAIRAARKEFGSLQLMFQLDVPASMTLVKEMCGLEIVDKYLESLSEHQS
ncbi:hypothetical protein VPH35_132476 [Triticum aestivum]